MRKKQHGECGVLVYAKKKKYVGVTELVVSMLYCGVLK
jgi:hypothetical protein